MTSLWATPVREYASDKLISVTPDTPLAHVHDLLLQRDFSAVPVIDAKGELLGIISTNRCAAQSNASVDFASEVQPIFQARCILCHGSEVQMGGLRLDQRQNLLKGSKSGVPAIVAGKSAERRYVSCSTRSPAARMQSRNCAAW